jgi:O-antigen/teichoic acid export membrane protein
MSPVRPRLSDEDIARIQRRMRFETWSVLTIIIALVLAAIAVAAFPIERVLPVFIVALVVVFVASISWVVGYVRTEKAFARIQSETSPRQPLWKYVAPLGAGLLTGAKYVLFPQYGRWIWSAFSVAGILAFIWVQVRRRRRAGVNLAPSHERR